MQRSPGLGRGVGCTKACPFVILLFTWGSRTFLLGGFEGSTVLVLRTYNKPLGEGGGNKAGKSGILTPLDSANKGLPLRLGAGSARPNPDMGAPHPEILYF